MSARTDLLWLHLDYRDRLKNLDFLKRAVHKAEAGQGLDAYLSCLAFLQVERIREERKEQELRYYGLEHAPYSLIGKSEETIVEMERRWLARLEQALEAHEQRNKERQA
jgi:hypothetical protein